MLFIIRFLCLLTAIFFLCITIAGFVPFALNEERLFGLIKVNSALNFFHFFTALAAAAAAYSEDQIPFVFFRIFGVAYLMIALIGVLHFGYPLFGFLANSYEGNFFHAIIGGIFLGLSTLGGSFSKFR